MGASRFLPHSVTVCTVAAVFRYLDARGLKQARNDMKGQVDDLTAQLAKCKSDALTWKFAASARDKAKRDKERWKDIKDQQKAPPVVVMDKWEVERDGLGKVVQPPTKAQGYDDEPDSAPGVSLTAVAENGGPTRAT